MEARRGPSMESDTRHLLDPSRPASIIGSTRPPSITTQDDKEQPQSSRMSVSEEQWQPRERSQSVPEIRQPYRGFASRDAYYDALLEFAREKTFFSAEQQLKGFYGTKTIQEYMDEKGGARSLSKKDRKAQKERRRSEQPHLAGVPENEAEAESEGTVKEQARRPSWAMFRRRSRVRT